MPSNRFIDRLNLTEAQKAFLYVVEQQMGIVADLSRADVLLYARKNPQQFIVISHAQPHSLAHVYIQGRAGRVVPIDHRPEIQETLVAGTSHTGQRSVITEGAPVVRETLPVHYPPLHNPDFGPDRSAPQVIAALVIVTNLIEHERHKFRSQIYRTELKKLQAMLLNGIIKGAENLSSFGEQDGILFVNTAGIIEYASGIAANLYRRVGYIDTLAGRHLKDLDTQDEELRRDALMSGQCMEHESEESDRYWVRKAIPVLDFAPRHWPWWQRLRFMGRSGESGVLIVVHDDTQIRRQDEEIRIKNAMIQEVHHRVKNNLQTIAGLLRMQKRRVKSEEAKLALDEALNRILSVAVIHEFLSSGGSNIINIKDVCGRIISQFQMGMLNPEQQIRIDLTAETIFLPARQATACSLIINELLQNSVEHGFEIKQQGVIQVNLADNGDEVMITVADDGDGVPEDFRLENSSSLGLQIIKTLVESDLKGRIRLSNGINSNGGLAVEIVFPKSIFEGEEGWKEHVSL